MKKTNLYLMASLAMLAATSCSNDDMTNLQGSADGNSVLRISIPAKGPGTRAFGDGQSANTLEYAVYDKDAYNSFVTSGSAAFTGTGDELLTTTVSINLANGRDYNIVFFAHHDAPGASSPVYSFDEATAQVAVDYSQMTAYNSADYDCFSTVYNTGVVTGPISENITLTRPVAQVNWGTSDLADPAVTSVHAYDKGDDNKAKNLLTDVSVKGVSNTLNLLTGERSSSAGFDGSVAFNALARPEGETFPIEDHDYLSMQYVLVPETSSVIDLVLNSYNAPGGVALSTVNVTNAPVQANYRTNIYGALLTNAADFTVTKDKNFDTPSYDVKVVNTAAEFISAIAEGGKIHVPADVDFSVANAGILTISNDTELIVDGVVKTARQGDTANIVVADGAKLTLTGGGTLQGDNRIVDVNGELTVNDVNFVTSTKTKGSAIMVCEGGEMIFESGNINAANTAVWVEGKATVNGGVIKSTNSSKDPEVGNGWAYAFRMMQPTADVVINGGEIEGIQGAIAVKYGKLTVNDGFFHTHPKFTSSDNFYAMYIGDGGGVEVTINGGEFYSQNKPSIYFEEYYYGDEPCKLMMKGGKFNNKGRKARYDIVGDNTKPTWTYADELAPYEGYIWADRDNEHLPFEVVKK